MIAASGSAPKGAADVIVWRTATARLDGRRTGPLFLTGRRASVKLLSGDLDLGPPWPCTAGGAVSQVFVYETLRWSRTARPTAQGHEFLHREVLSEAILGVGCDFVLIGCASITDLACSTPSPATASIASVRRPVTRRAGDRVSGRRRRE
ncbi:hypothetical protein [Nonomuraea sp. NPDC050310]|uniref:hypothetical protein n=1 Tax=Nonomuraea sp. NPDC050310 TaxID=3154935 RepID=UPI0033CD1DB7